MIPKSRISPETQNLFLFVFTVVAGCLSNDKFKDCLGLLELVKITSQWRTSIEILAKKKKKRTNIDNFVAWNLVSLPVKIPKRTDLQRIHVNSVEI